MLLVYGDIVCSMSRLTLSQATTSMMLLATCCLPAIRPRWERFHQGIWRKAHWILTGGILIAFGLLLRSISPDARPYYACAIGLLAMEGFQAGCRRTVRDAAFQNVSDTGVCMIEAPACHNVCNYGTFYYFRGKPFPALPKTSGQKATNVIILAAGELEYVKTGQKSVEVEGPYGPGIGPLWWIYYWLLRTLKRPILVDAHRPPHFIYDSNIRICVDQTAIARGVSLWLWHINHGSQPPPEIEGWDVEDSWSRVYERLLVDDESSNIKQNTKTRLFHLINIDPIFDYLEKIFTVAAERPSRKDIIDNIQRMLMCPSDDHSAKILVGGEVPKYLYRQGGSGKCIFI